MAPLECARRIQESFVVVYDPSFDPGRRGMEFQLTYEGLLLACDSDRRVDHKHEIRKHLHPQLKRLWEIDLRLSKKKYPWPNPQEAAREMSGPVGPSWPEGVGRQFSRCGYEFVPLVIADISLLCALEILWLRPGEPGGLIKSGDIDNRLKTLFDALKMPEDSSQLGKYTKPALGEAPFYCLLQDDKLISRLQVQTGILLQPTTEQPDPNDTRLIITVKLQPHHLNWVNADFA